MYTAEQQLIIAECAALTLADLANLNIGDRLEELSGRLWFLEMCASEIEPEVAQRLRDAMLAAQTLADDAIAAVGDFAALLPDATD